jgi:nucleotide-binding universal stress UspA family protein
MLPIHTILHPTDFSERSTYAFRLACSLARDLKAKVLVLHVVPPPVSYGETVARRQEDSYYDDLWQELCRIKSLEPTVMVQHRLEDGEVAQRILDIARESRADLIVMGTHGRTGLRRLLMGSVAEEVVRNADCPVLTVRSPFEKERGEEPAGSAADRV